MHQPPPPERLAILEAALHQFAEVGFEMSTMADIAARADVPLGEVYRHFPAKHGLVHALYGQLADTFAEQAADLPPGPISERFRAAMLLKFDLIDTHRAVLSSLFAAALDRNQETGVLSEATAHVRSRVAGVFAVVVHGATNRPKGDKAQRWSRMLYGLHLALILAWTQDRSDGSASREAVALVADTMGKVGPFLAFLPSGGSTMRRVDEVFHGLLQGAAFAPPSEAADIVLDRLLHQRRLAPGEPDKPSSAARALHLPTIHAAMATGRPLQLVLPAFPAKAPNPAKVLGALPDLAEALALRHLEELCARLTEAYPPGVDLTICSDGHVFADVVGVPDADVTAYREALRHNISAPLRVFDLMDVYGQLSPEAARQRLFSEWAESTEALREEAERSAQTMRLVNGMHRFLMEDLLRLEPELSKSQARKRTREAAWEMVRRSRAWGRLVGACFPQAVRLSIHPQPDVSVKIGVHLLPVDDVWLTPWHGVALLEADRVRLLRRADAESLGAVMVERDGRPSHFELS